MSWFAISWFRVINSFPVDTGRKLNDIRYSEDVSDVFWTSYVRSIYVLCLLGYLVHTEFSITNKIIFLFQINDTFFFRNILTPLISDNQWPMGQNIQEWAKQNLWKTAFEKF